MRIRISSLLLQRMRDLERLEAYHQVLQGEVAHDGSALAADATHALGSLVWIQAGGAWAVGCDHAMTWRRLVAAKVPFPAWAHGTLLRGAWEGGTRCQWLLESVDSGQRIARAVSEELTDFARRSVYEQTKGVTPAAGGTGAYWHAIAKAEARRHGVTPEKMPGFDKVAGDRPGGGGIYQGLSALAHGRSWAVNLSHLEPLGRDAMGRDSGIVTADPGFMLEATGYVMAALRFGLMQLEAYVGVPHEPDWWPQLREEQ